MTTWMVRLDAPGTGNRGDAARRGTGAERLEGVGTTGTTTGTASGTTTGTVTGTPEGAEGVTRFRLAVKDCIDVEGVPTTVGCQVIAAQARNAAADAPVVAAARRAGARIVGKTNLTELCWSASGVNEWSGTPRNPLDPERVPGGSSSGSAVAVATGEADIALGTDTGGSVRIPAACCGIVGLKTTWGRVPAAGVHPLAPSMDSVGPIGANVAVVELGMRLVEPGFAAAPAEPAVGRIRVAGVDPRIDAAADAALARAAIVATDVTGLDFAAADAAATVLIDAEGYQSNAHLMPWLDQLSPHTQRKLTLGARVAAAEVARARQVRDSVRGWFMARLGEQPFLAMPTLAMLPPKLRESRAGQLTWLTVPVNMAGLPALALPVPIPGESVPASLQLIGPPGSEERLITLGRLVEAALAAP